MLDSKLMLKTWFFSILLLVSSLFLPASAGHKRSFGIKGVDDHDLTKLLAAGKISFSLDSLSSRKKKFRLGLSSNVEGLLDETKIKLTTKGREELIEIDLNPVILDQIRAGSLDVSSIRISIEDQRSKFIDRTSLFWAEDGRFYSRDCDFDERDLRLKGDKRAPRVECGDLIVLEDREDEDSRHLLLNIAIFRSDIQFIEEADIDSTADDSTTNSETLVAVNPVIMLEGGPGGRFVPSVSADLFGKGVFSARDLIVYDQRGVGNSSPALFCEKKESNKECSERLNGIADLEQYHSAANADDVADIVSALQLDQVVLFGGSYGSRLGLEVIRRHPDLVEAAALDGIYPSDKDILSENIKSFEDSLARVFELCEDDSKCNSAYPNLESRFDALMQDLADEPISFGPFEITSEDVFFTLNDLLFSAEGIATIPQFIDDLDFSSTDLFLKIKHPPRKPIRVLGPSRFQAQAGEQMGSLEAKEDGLETKEDGLEASDNPDKIDIFDGVNNTIICAELFTQFDESYANELADSVRIGMSDLLLDYALDTGKICKDWTYNKELPSENFDSIISDDHRVLFMNGELDHVTPLSFAQGVAEDFPNSTLVSLPKKSHSFMLSDDCAQSILKSFMANPSNTDLDTSCSSEAKIDWLTAF